MAREIIKANYNSYEDISSVIESIDSSWNKLRTLDRFKLCKHPFRVFYVNPISPIIEDIKGPYKVFDLEGNILIKETTNKSFKADLNLFKYGSIVVYLKTVDYLYMLFISNNAITTKITQDNITVNIPTTSSITINNTTINPIYYSYNNTPVEPFSLLEIPPGVIEIFQPTSIGYLFIKTNQAPVIINTSNTRTKLVNDYFLLLCPDNFSKIQVAKFTGNSLNTIEDNLTLNIVI